MGIKKLKPVDSIVAEISPQVVCDDLARNSMEWLIRTAVTSDRHTIYTALREGIEARRDNKLFGFPVVVSEKAVPESGYCDGFTVGFNTALDQTLTLLDELFGVSK